VATSEVNSKLKDYARHYFGTLFWAKMCKIEEVLVYVIVIVAPKLTCCSYFSQRCDLCQGIVNRKPLGKKTVETTILPFNILMVVQ